MLRAERERKNREISYSFNLKKQEIRNYSTILLKGPK